MNIPKTTSIRRDWISKTLSGWLLGAMIAFACSGIFVDAAHTLPLPIRGQLAMWMVPPIWLGILTTVYLFQTGRQAWLWLGTTSAIVTCIFFLQHHA